MPEKLWNQGRSPFLWPNMNKFDQHGLLFLKKLKIRVENIHKTDSQKNHVR